MKKFNYSIPTEIFFGKGQISVLGREIKKYGSKVLLVYGGGSIKRNGIYDSVLEILQKEQIEVCELGSVDPNPRINSVRKGVEICRENSVNFILAVGGGSSIDCAKVIAAGVSYKGDVWELVVDPRKVEDVLPIGTILTLAATGSEMDGFAVISNLETKEKLGTGHDKMKPKFSILDPTYTYTVPKNQTAAGTADIMSHVFEVYFSDTKEAFLQDRMAESILKTCIKYGKVAIENPQDYEARANLMWASSLAINGLLSYGKDTNWCIHGIEHELSAYYDITHGVGLAIITVPWFNYILNDDTLYKFVEYGVNVWDIDKNLEHYEIAKLAIEKTANFYKELNIPMSLKELNITDENFEKMAEGAVRYGNIGQIKSLNKQDVINILKKSL
ncbi:hypothetical protein SAMN02745163_00542 [Clostridium cavendishii DSM 21758]|uniref:Uncharacterized protein n=1 Tax=Clostridium cavendishii DSM 21758 TaxID=1121302 RepID=A0A1M6CT48_9CLOT|nr:iron-containing alcohol dehydrogenase [Clostridium cavendishii]SHI64031.1 hypothetical protein SAMN02745163_00542 [Clostridium cavendishii DSM 21758]